METQYKMNRYFYISGVVLLLAGAIDPLEGSILIAIGSLLLALATYRKGDAQWKFFQVTFIMITVGVIAMFYLSSLGGFGGNSSLSWWWGLLILPYPAGWLMDVVALIIRWSKKSKAVI
jgi:multisubunit Na+/H+ antiporter MnhB subunit